MEQPQIFSQRPDRDEYWFHEGCFVTELVNSPVDEALSVARIRVPPDGKTRWHALAGISERYVILAGHGEVELGGHPPRPVTAHDVVLIPPDCPQRICNTGAADLEFLALCTPRFVPEAYRDLDDSAPRSPDGAESDS